MEKRLDSNNTRMLRAILNKIWTQHPTKQQLYGHSLSMTKTIQVGWTKHAGHGWRIKDELISDVLLWTLHMDEQRQYDQPEPTCKSSVPIQDVTLKTYRKRWTIGKDGGLGSGISVLMAWHHDDDDDEFYWDLFGLNKPTHMVQFTVSILDKNNFR